VSALVPICQTGKDIDLAGLGEVLPEEVPRTILVGRRIDEIVTGPPGPGAEGPARGLGDGLVRPGRQRLNISFECYLFGICRRHEIRSRCGVVRPFPHRNGIVAKSPFRIDVRHNDRAMEGVPVFP
jgi:hypothetical protein